MRVTNGMIRQNMLYGLNTNMSKLDTLYNQMNTLKKIQRPSDDPIIAGRSLKLKINVLETAQYTSNTKEATSWMDTSEAALKNVTEILKDIRTRSVQASTDTLDKEDRDKILNDITQLWDQLQQEANVTYAGRYVFSGYKTDQPVMLTQDKILTEEMTVAKGMDLPKGATLADGSTLKLEVGTVLSKDDAVALGYTVPAGDTNYTVTTAATVAVPTTGLTLSGNIQVAKDSTLASGTVFRKGSVNPEILNQENTAAQNIQYEIGVGNTLSVNTVGMANTMQDIGKDIKEIIDALNEAEKTGDDTKLNAMFSGKLTDFDDRLADVSEKLADLGSRMTRLDYTATRLVEDKTNFTELLSNTENVDLEEIYIEFNTQYMIYQSALQATSKVIMNTLADFLN